MNPPKQSLESLQSLPIFKHSQEANEPCYLILARFEGLSESNLHNIEQKIAQKIIVGIISQKENLKYFEKYNKEKVILELIECTNPTLLWAYLCYKNYPLLPNYRIAITGTSGKTSTTWFVYQLLLSMNKKVLLINSLGIFANGKKIGDTINTTPDSAIIHEYANDFVKENGVDSYLICETSSIAIEQNRIAFVNPNIGVWINFSHEHLDYHKTIEKYHAAKMALGKLCEQFFIHNSIDRTISKNIFSEEFVKKEKYIIYGKELKEIKQKKSLYMKFEFDEKIYETECDIFGEFQAHNILSSIIALMALNIYKIDEIIKQIPNLSSPIGRMQKITHNNKLVLIDNAHKPEALKSALKSILQFKKPNAKLIVICGCGGNRDKEKRPIMGQIMQKLADIAIITSDNPRNEDPISITNEMLSGCKQDSNKQKDDKNILPKIILDRKMAIEYGINLMNENDILLIAGKGNEIYQEFENGKKVPFDDYLIACEIIAKI